MDWVHCNNCFVQPGEVEGKKFVITNCFHIYCLDCVQQPELKQCRICQSSYKTMPLSSKMTKEVEIYFTDPLEGIQKLLKVLGFQNSHRARLTAHNLERIGKLKTLKKEIMLLKEELKRAQEENVSLRDEMKQINGELVEYKQKLQYLMSCQSSTNTASYGSYNDKKITPKLVKSNIGLGLDYTVIKRPPETSNFFFKASSKQTQNDSDIFSTPTNTRISASYRSLRSSSSDMITPPIPTTSVTEFSQKNQYHRKVKLPGDRGGPSPTTRAAFRRLTLSKLTSTPKKDVNENKYSQYFNK